MREEDATAAENSLINLQIEMRGWRRTGEAHKDPAWRKRVEDELTKLAQALGCVPRESDAYGPLDFVAKILYAHDCEHHGFVPGPWHALTDSTKSRFREQAVATVASWASEELKNERIMGMPTKLVPK